MLQVVQNKHNDNPFYGLKNCLTLYQNSSKVVNTLLLDACWQEVKGNREHRAMFFSLLFSIGDITGRQHNIFGKNKIDTGGSSNRENFLNILIWLKRTNKQQFLKFLKAGLINEFTSFDSLLAMRITTKKKTQKITKIIDMTEGIEDDLAKYIASVIKGKNPYNKYFVSKFLTRPRVSKRSKHKKMLPETKKLMRKKESFLQLVSDYAGLKYLKKETHIEFYGYYNWRKEYNESLESVLFSSGKIKEFDKQEFIKWLEGIPSQARYRVRTRLLTKSNQPKDVEKYGELHTWFLEWENFKSTKQAEQRVLEEKVRQGDDSTETKVKLAKVQKEAKVTTGAVNFKDMFKEIIQGTVDKIKVQPFLDKVNLAYNTLVFVDDSGSMSSIMNTDYRFSAFDFATFMATICMTKNPDDVGRNLIGLYSQSCRMFNHIDSKAPMSNSFMRPQVRQVNEPFIDGKLHFLDNLKRMREFCYAHRTGNGTNLASIPEGLHSWTKGDATLIEQLQQYPVWTIITDGNWNQMHSPEASMNDFMARCERYFGFKPYIIAIDVADSSSAKIDRFQGIENFMFVQPNPAQIEQLLTNFKDMDIMDVYTPLNSFYKSNRYRLVQENTL